MNSQEEITETMRTMLRALGAEKSLCPSDVARAIGGNHPDGWGPLMQPIRHIAVQLASAGEITILRKGAIADPANFKGIYRLSLPRID